MKLKIFYMIVLFLFIHDNCVSQKKSYKSIPPSHKKNYVGTKIPANILTQAVNIDQYLPQRLVKDGSTDYTSFLQKALDENAIVIIPKGIYSTTGLKMRSNSTLIFEDGAELRMIPNDRERYEIIAITGVENISLYNPKLKGDLRNRKILKGEWGFGIDIRGSRNVSIYSPYILDCLGDGIVISRSSKGINDPNIKLFDTSNILIENAFIDYMGRNGISVIGVDGLKIKSPIITNVFKRSPMSAIDIEPDHSAHKLDNIVIESPFTFNNTDGIMVNLRNFVSSKVKTSNIVINNHVDVESTYPLNIPDLRDNKSHKAIRGKLVVNNPVWIDTDHSMVRGQSYNLSHQIEINNPTLRGMKLKSWRGKKIEGLSDREKLIIHIKDKVNFSIK